MNNLYASGSINEKIFAIHFDHFGGSTVEFGGYDPTKMLPNVPLTYLEVPYKDRWQVKINAFRVGKKPTFDNGSKSAFYHDDKVAVIDSFSPYIKLPASIAVQIYSKFFHEVPGIQQEKDILLGPCDTSKYSSINLFVNDRFYIKLMPESFVVDIGVRGKCLIPFAFNNVDEYVLGEPFFRNFYSVFDDSKGLLGIAPSINFVSSSIIEGIVPNDELPHPADPKKNHNSKNNGQ